MLTKKKIKDLVARRHDLIPGGAHTYSKGDDQFPSNAPKVVLKGKGAYVWAEDGKKYLDWSMGLRSVVLGHCYGAVNSAVSKQIKEGTNFVRPHISEFELADYLIKRIPHVEMVKFTKNGSTSTSAATKLARAYTGRKYIVACNQDFYSYDDWFIGATTCNAGIPEEIKKLTLIFKYNDIDSLKKLFKEHPGQIACVIMEAITSKEPVGDFLHQVEKITKENGAVFILDEMITGFRFNLGGASKIYGLKPDLVTYGKAVANGYSLSILGGKKEIMELGGLYHKKERVFLISTTHGAESTALAAALATIKELDKKDVPKYFWKTGGKLKKSLTALISKHSLSDFVEIIGFAPHLSMIFRGKDGAISFLFKTIFLQEVIKKGIFFQGYFAISYSHQAVEIDRTLKVFDEVLKKCKKIFQSDNPKEYLVGEVVKPVFRKYN